MRFVVAIIALLGTAGFSQAQEKARSELIFANRPQCGRPHDQGGSGTGVDGCHSAITRLKNDANRNKMVTGVPGACMNLAGSSDCTITWCDGTAGVKMPMGLIGIYATTIASNCRSTVGPFSEGDRIYTGGTIYVEGVHPYGQGHVQGTIYVGHQDHTPFPAKIPTSDHDEFKVRSLSVGGGALVKGRATAAQDLSPRAVGDTREIPNARDWRLRVAWVSRESARATAGHVTQLVRLMQRDVLAMRGVDLHRGVAVGNSNRVTFEPTDVTSISLETRMTHRDMSLFDLPRGDLPEIATQVASLWRSQNPGGAASNNGPAVFEVMLERRRLGSIPEGSPGGGSDWQPVASFMISEFQRQVPEDFLNVLGAEGLTLQKFIRIGS